MSNSDESRPLLFIVKPSDRCIGHDPCILCLNRCLLCDDHLDHRDDDDGVCDYCRPIFEWVVSTNPCSRQDVREFFNRNKFTVDMRLALKKALKKCMGTKDWKNQMWFRFKVDPYTSK
jgi:hypothetical protein